MTSEMTYPIATTSSERPRLSIDTVRSQIVGLEVQVPLLDGSCRRYVNLDNAASTPALRPVAEKVAEFLLWYASVHRGTGLKSQVSTKAYDDAHQVIMELVGADPATHTAIFGKNSTEALNKLARRLPWKPGDVVVATTMEHHSNDLPWRAMVETLHVRVDAEGRLDEEHLDDLLRAYAGRVRLVAITGASNVSGYINPIHRIAERAHAAGVQILVDAAQLAPHRAVDMGSLDDPAHFDYLVLSGHKMYAPFGSGALIGRRDTFLQGAPDVVGGGTVELVTLDSVMWNGLPDREEAGSPNVVGAVAMASAMLCLQEIGMEAIAEHEARLTAHLLRRLGENPAVHIYGDADPEQAARRLGVVSFNLKALDHYLVAAILGHEFGIGVRNGCFCAHPYMMHLLGVGPEQTRRYHKYVEEGLRAYLPGLVRVSFGCYNDEAEVDWFVESLGRIARQEYTGRYVQDPASGTYMPEGGTVQPAAYFSLR